MTFLDGGARNYVQLGIQVAVIRFGSEGSSTTSTSYVVIADSDIVIDFDNWKTPGGKVFVKFKAHLRNDGANLTSVEIYRQNAATSVAGSEITNTGDWTIVESGWIDFSGESGDESYQLRIKVAAGTGYVNGAMIIIAQES